MVSNVDNNNQKEILVDLINNPIRPNFVRINPFEFSL